MQVKKKNKQLLESEYLETILKCSFGDNYLQYQLENLDKLNKQTAQMSKKILFTHKKPIDYVKWSVCQNY